MIKPENNTDEDLSQAINDYIQWMGSVGYADQTRKLHRSMLNAFLGFIQNRRIRWDDIFTIETMTSFKADTGVAFVRAIRGLSRYLFEQKRIAQPVPRKHYRLSKPYETYLTHYTVSRGASYRQIRRIRRVLAALQQYLRGEKITLASLQIEHVDAFLAQFFSNFSPDTCKVYRSMLRDFLTYLYQERKIIKRNLAPLVIGPPQFSRSKPPKFLRPDEVERLFAAIEPLTPVDIRTYVMVHLAFFLGLRPKEIISITLDDIFFKKRLLTLRDRKTKNPTTLPIPEKVLKAISLYLIGARPQSRHRTLFLSLKAPYGPITTSAVSDRITAAMRKADLCASVYWLRHTYAQNMLEAGLSIYEIKEMLGHHNIESSRKYLHVHLSLMRKVLFDETV
jgi:site-specific recombinase XerD